MNLTIIRIYCKIILINFKFDICKPEISDTNDIIFYLCLSLSMNNILKSFKKFIIFIVIYVEQKFKPLLLQSITIDAKPSLDRSLPHTPFTSGFYIFCLFAFDAKEWVVRPSFYRERQKEDS